MAKAKSLLRVLRAAKEPKLTQAQLARSAEVHLPGGQTMSMQRYWQIENGEGTAPSDTEKGAVAAALGVLVSEIAWPDITREVRAS